MRLSAFFAGLLLVSLFHQVRGYPTMVGQYGEAIEIPCNNGIANPENIFITKWKYNKNDGSTGDLLIKTQGKNVSVLDNADFKGRISLAKDLSLRISQAKLVDQKIFTCIIVNDNDISEYSVQVKIHKTPSAPTITNQATEMEIGKLTMLGECSTQYAYPAANVSWYKNGVPLLADQTGVKLTTAVQEDKTTGLMSTSSKLEYMAVKGDLNAKFTCAVHHKSLTSDLVSAPVTFVLNYPPENISLLITPADTIKEGDNVTLKCRADGNPPPAGYSFHIKGKKVTVEKSDTYTLTGVTRASTGEYKCSLLDNEAMSASRSIVVMYLDIALSTRGNVIKRVGENFEAAVVANASGEAQISWSKNKAKLNGAPRFGKLKLSDSGVYECVASMAGIEKKASFELSVQGPPVISRLTKRRSDDGMFKVLSCEAHGSPAPSVLWSINGTNATESAFGEGKVIHKITISPMVNLTVNCTVVNSLGQDTKSIDVSTLFDEVTMDKRDQAEGSTDQTRLVVGIVVGLLLAALAIGLTYWLFMKKTREGTWKTGEKEDGTLEESKKLEENQSQKAEV
ncbi:activated leukocyte cell adhesion molecule b isoform X2 [Brachyhypopomus gauderio]|uniref:activated leukocyte cell adhesion molecule b isoform X2 n=1 Tax=Brachyhypopomus gauderio TaxID=698409 RepID=UPI0040425994